MFSVTKKLFSWRYFYRKCKDLWIVYHCSSLPDNLLFVYKIDHFNIWNKLCSNANELKIACSSKANSTVVYNFLWKMSSKFQIFFSQTKVIEIPLIISFDKGLKMSCICNTLMIWQPMTINILMTTTNSWLISYFSHNLFVIIYINIFILLKNNALDMHFFLIYFINKSQCQLITITYFINFMSPVVITCSIKCIHKFFHEACSFSKGLHLLFFIFFNTVTTVLNSSNSWIGRNCFFYIITFTFRLSRTRPALPRGSGTRTHTHTHSLAAWRSLSNLWYRSSMDGNLCSSGYRGIAPANGSPLSNRWSVTTITSSTTNRQPSSTVIDAHQPIEITPILPLSNRKYTLAAGIDR